MLGAPAGAPWRGVGAANQSLQTDSAGAAAETMCLSAMYAHMCVQVGGWGFQELLQVLHGLGLVLPMRRCSKATRGGGGGGEGTGTPCQYCSGAVHATMCARLGEGDPLCSMALTLVQPIRRCSRQAIASHRDTRSLILQISVCKVC